MTTDGSKLTSDYVETLTRVLRGPEIAGAEHYAQVFLKAWNTGKRIYL